MLKRGHTPTILLYLGMCVIMIFALFVLAHKSDEQEQISLSFAETIEQASFARAHTQALTREFAAKSLEDSEGTFSLESFRTAFERHADVADPKDGSAGNFFAKIRNGDYVTMEENTNYVLIIQNVSVTVTHQKNEIIRTFDVRVRFSQQGVQ